MTKPEALDVVLLTAKDVARILSVRVTRVYQLPIPQCRVGTSVRFHPDDMRAYLEKIRRNGSSERRYGE